MTPALGSCQDEYPLEPTPCDDWCRESRRLTCEQMAPAECVASCEQEFGRREHPECAAQLDTTLACYEALPDRELCGPVDLDTYGGTFPCDQELMALYECVFPLEPSAEEPPTE